jgi:peptidoglycan hydrolase CwlO-like protein
MSIELAIAGIIGLIVGLQINKTGIKERDKRIQELDQRVQELENELIVKQNVAEALNATVQRLRQKLKENAEKTDTSCGGRDTAREETEERTGGMASGTPKAVVSRTTKKHKRQRL